MTYPRFYTLRVVVYPEKGLIEKHMNNGFVREVSGTQNGNGYLWTSINGKKKFMHRLIWEYVRGPVPAGTEIDHINGDRTDNRIDNLRLVTRNQNNQNRPTANVNSKSQVKGVCWCKRAGKWRATLTHERRHFYLGYFATIEDAQDAYASAAALLHTHNPHAAP